EGPERIEEAKEAESLVKVDGPIATTWRSFSRTAFSLIDGTPFPDGIQARQFDVNGRRAVVADLPHHVAPRPVRHSGASRHNQVRSCDPLRTDPDLCGDRPQSMEPGRLERA